MGVVCTLGLLGSVTKTFLSSGGTGAFSVEATEACSWTAEVNSDSTLWLKILSGESATGRRIVL
jgi:hypothetical protein